MHETTAPAVATGVADGAGKHGPMASISDAVSIDLPLQTRTDVRLQAETIDAEARTIEMVWSTGAPVRRRDLFTGRRYDEVLSLDPRHVDLSRLNAGAPLLNAHGAASLSNVLGVVERAWVACPKGTPQGVRAGDAFEGRALVRFSEREDVEPLWQDIRAGIIRSVSVGYAVRAYEVSEQDGSASADAGGVKVPLWRAIDWQPLELSAVPIAADSAAGFRGHQALLPCRLIHRAAAAHHPETEAMDQPTLAAENRAATDTSTLTNEDTVTRENAEDAMTAADETSIRGTAAEPAEQPGLVEHDAVTTEDIARRVIAEERARIAGIYDAARKLAIDTSIADDLVRRGATLDEARSLLIDAAAARDQAVETRPHIRTGGIDECETRRWSPPSSTALIRIDIS